MCLAGTEGSFPVWQVERMQQQQVAVVPWLLSMRLLLVRSDLLMIMNLKCAVLI